MTTTAPSPAAVHALALPTKRSATVRAVLVGLARLLLTIAGSVVVLFVVWIVFLKLFHIGSFQGKTPGDVWRYLTESPNASANREVLRRGVAETLYDATVGFVVGFSASVLIAVVFVLSRPVERSLMPAAMAIRSVPIVAMVPVLALVFGRGLTGTIITVSIVVFFPTLVLVAFGLRSVRQEALELMSVYDAGSITTLRKVQLPTALPSVFAAATIAAPGAVLGALLSEWLITGRGLGNLMSVSVTSSKYAQLWSAAMIVMILSIVLYSVISAIEDVVNARFGAIS